MGGIHTAGSSCQHRNQLINVRMAESGSRPCLGTMQPEADVTTNNFAPSEELAMNPGEQWC